MRRVSLLLAGLLLILFTSCNFGSANNESSEGKVIVSLKSNARTITPVSWNFTDCKDWTLIFNGNDKSIQFTKNESADSFECTVPTGTYKVTLEGKVPASGGNQAYKLYGETQDVVVSASQNTSVTIYLSLKKSSDGKGEFQYDITLSNLLGILVDPIEDPKHTGYKSFGTFSAGAYLTSVKDESVIIPLETDGAKSASDIFISYTGTNIPSGYYYFTANYILNDSLYSFPLPDALVEISDGTKTTGSYSDSLFTGEKTKNIYISNNSADTYNGITPSFKKEFNSALNWLAANPSEWTVANLYFAIKSIPDGEENIEIINAMYPRYNVATSNPTTSNDGKIVKVYVDSSPNPDLYFQNGKVCYKSANINLYSETLTDELFEVELMGTDYEVLYFFLNNARISLNCGSLYSGLQPTIGIMANENLLTAYNPDNSKPIATISYDSKVANGNKQSISSLETGISTDYTVFYKESGETPFVTSLFTAYSGTASVNPYVQDFQLILTNDDDEFLVDDVQSVECKAKVGEGESFREGTTFRWFLNGTEITDETSDTIIIDYHTNPNVIIGNNVVMVVVSCNGNVDNRIITFKLIN